MIKCKHMIQVQLNGKNGLGKVALVDGVDADLGTLSWWVGAGYAMRTGSRLDGKPTICLHRLVLQRMLGVQSLPKGFVTDHINGNPLDNRRSNLRLVTHHQNMLNCKGNAQGRSGYKGVGWHTSSGLWRAKITYDLELYNIGYFKDKDEAAWMYDQWALCLHGEYARLNFEYA